MDTKQKPLTKALHTVRVVRRIADHLLLDGGFYEEVCQEDYHSEELVRGEILLQHVCALLGNEMPVGYDPLYGACHVACEEALRAFEGKVEEQKKIRSRVLKGGAK